jgi:hypothetical protein
VISRPTRFLFSISPELPLTDSELLNCSLATLSLTPAWPFHKSKSNSRYDLRSVDQSLLVSIPIWGPTPDLYYCETVAGWFKWGALSDEKTCVIYDYWRSSPAHSWCVESRGTHDHILFSQIRDSTNLEGQVPVFLSPRKTVAQLCSQALGSLFVVSYYSQGYGGNIRIHLHRFL